MSTGESLYTKKGVDNLLAAKQDVLTAGTGIDITNDVISTNILPTYSSADAGKVLSIDSDGNLVWVTPQ